MVFLASCGIATAWLAGSEEQAAARPAPAAVTVKAVQVEVTRLPITAGATVRVRDEALAQPQSNKAAAMSVRT
jgi:hypothetical protein